MPNSACWMRPTGLSSYTWSFPSSPDSGCMGLGNTVSGGRRGVNFSEQPPSKQWAALKYRGETIAEVWFKPEGQPFSLTFRIPQSSFHIPGVGQRLTTENLLKAVGIAPDEVESWRHEGASHSDMNQSH